MCQQISFMYTVWLQLYAFCFGMNQASRYAIQHVWYLSQARINWEGCGRKGIPRKTGGIMAVGASMVQMAWHLARLSVHLPLLSSPHVLKSCLMSSGSGPPG